MTCEFCNGTKQQLSVVTHPHTNKPKLGTIPCVCMTSEIVSRENKLIQHLGSCYIHPDKLIPEFSLTFSDLSKIDNFIIQPSGSSEDYYNSFLLQVKALLMKHRFEDPKPRILFSRAIDIIHDYHVPQTDGSPVLHLSALSVFDLIIIIFGTTEKNQALGPCMSQVFGNRVDDEKPTWIYLPKGRPTLASCDQEYSVDLERITENFKKIKIEAVEGQGDKLDTHSKSKAAASNFTIG